MLFDNSGSNNLLETNIHTNSRVATQLLLADNSAWGISAGDDTANTALLRLMEIMQLRDQHCANPHIHVRGNCQDPGSCSATQNFPGLDAGMAAKYSSRGLKPCLPLAVSFHQHGALCELIPVLDDMKVSIQLSLLSLVIARYVEAHGAVLLHGALAEWNGAGIILAGQSGTGKSTASRRLPLPWRSLSDDMVLVVRDAHGTFWAHPWPTWSRFFFSRSCRDTWNVEHAVPLRGLFFLKPAEADEVSAIGSGEAAASLVQSAEQASIFMQFTTEDDRRVHKVLRFETICALAHSVPSYKLELSLNGPFWHLLENTITA